MKPMLNTLRHHLCPRIKTYDKSDCSCTGKVLAVLVEVYMVALLNGLWER